jgi:hypothetical protein
VVRIFTHKRSTASRTTNPGDKTTDNQPAQHAPVSAALVQASRKIGNHLSFPGCKAYVLSVCYRPGPGPRAQRGPLAIPLQEPDSMQRMIGQRHLHQNQARHARATTTSTM